ncbi:MAG: SH3 domain-containing protein, partial [Chitinophagaceae bacterium]|nr:SH3 domain-containing protein [Anaerolineae bacterium]
MKKFWSLFGILPLIGIMLLSACSFGGGSAEEAAIPTDTLAPIVSRTPRFTATPIISRTPLPTFTPIPSETPIPPTPSNTLEPTATPPIIGIINSLQSVNVRAGPSTADDAILALNPGTGVEVLGTNIEGNWYNIRTEEGDEGWVSSGLVRLQPTPTAIPTFTTTPDLTALFLGTPLPTALLGGGTITPTPPRSAVTATPPSASGAGTSAAVVTTDTPAATQPFLPIRDLTAVYQTATALASGNAFITPRPGDANSPTPPSLTLPLTPGTITVPTAAILSTPAPSTPGASAPTTSGSAVVQQGVDVFALCDNPALGAAAPSNIATGSTIEVYWAWFASTQ